MKTETSHAPPTMEQEESTDYCNEQTQLPYCINDEVIIEPNAPSVYINMQHAANNDKKIFIALDPSQPHPVPPRRIEKYYKERKEVGSVIVHQTRFWVSYSTVLDKVFCTSCLLFGSKDDSNSLRDEFNNWDNLSHAINKHHSKKPSYRM